MVTQVTDDLTTERDNVLRVREYEIMATPSLVRAIGKLAAVGERAGFTLEEMIQLLDSGVSVETLLELIAQRLEHQPLESAQPTNWVM
jgi:hypothetical protein